MSSFSWRSNLALLRFVLVRIGFFFLLFPACLTPGNAQHKLWYDEPADNWLEALPMGNGRLGIMVYGGVEQEHIQFNEETLWTGKPRNYAHEGAYKYLDKIRELLFEGKQQEAQDLMAREFMSVPRSLMSYQPFGDLIIDFPAHEKYSGYRRELDLGNAVSRITYVADGVRYTREVFVSNPDQVIAIRIAADQPGALGFSAHLESTHFKKSVHTDFDEQTLDVRPAREPQRFDPMHPEESVLRGKAGMKIITDGVIEPEYDKIGVLGASYATIYVTAYTSFVNFRDVSGRPEWHIDQALRKHFPALDYELIKARHVEDHQKLFNRFTLHFEGTDRSSLPTDERIIQFWKDPDDPAFVAQYVQFGRYLMIASSRPGGQPANLQGIWNSSLEPPWKSKYTTNANAEMNYWPAELTNLSECHEPFIDLVRGCALTGAVTAREHYACGGWVLHHNTDIWRATAPINLPFIGPWVGGSGWVSHHIWEHFSFTMDTVFLREHYPILKGAAQFYSEFLIPDPETGWLISTPSNSPEIGGLVAGPAMDHQIIRSLFDILSKASGILNTDQVFVAELQEMKQRIAPNQIGRYGQLQEWLEDKDDPEEKHRHVSHLWAVYPGNGINWEDTPELMKAARQSLLFRGDGGTGWSLAWKINFWARFLDGDHAYVLVHNLLSPAEYPGREVKGGTYPNMFDAHPPFQIDGNLGGAAGIIELLVQSHLGSVDVLPALPGALTDGYISGVCARGGFELEFKWSDGALDHVTVLSKAGLPCILRYREKKIEFKTTKGGRYSFDRNLREIDSR